jgi:hypothetical protein
MDELRDAKNELASKEIALQQSQHIEYDHLQTIERLSRQVETQNNQLASISTDKLQA